MQRCQAKTLPRTAKRKNSPIAGAIRRSKIKLLNPASVRYSTLGCEDCVGAEFARRLVACDRSEYARLYCSDLPLTVKRLPFEPPWPVCRLWLADFQRARVRRTAGKAVVHRRNQYPRIHRLACRLELKVQVHGVIDRVAIGWIGRSQSFKVAEIDFDTVRLLDSLPRGSRLTLRRSSSPLVWVHTIASRFLALTTRIARSPLYSGETRCNPS